MTFTDHGQRCARHIGEAFPPRCIDCDVVAVQEAATSVEAKLGRYLPNSQCSLHEHYPLPCDLCRRLRDETLDNAA